MERNNWEAKLFGVEVLQAKHSSLQKEKHNFMQACDFDNAAIKQIEQKLLEDLAALLLHQILLATDELLPHSYYCLVKYFALDHLEQKKTLELQLKAQKRKLRLLAHVFDFRRSNLIHNEIRETERKLWKLKKIIANNRVTASAKTDDFL